ncbi:hypothetical protein HD806DRAFT_537718 [Xylariaceae sp. AK1471]|nr:hypothetical protein HD806DRAFT_537718 [Xylariaceae sp. AK1471]
MVCAMVALCSMILEKTSTAASQFISAMLQKEAAWTIIGDHLLHRMHCLLQITSMSLIGIHHGLIASGDGVVRSAIKRELEVQNLSDDVLCFEMQAAGLTTEFSYIVIRGISDYADSHKNDTWQHYAAAAAAACTKES